MSEKYGVDEIKKIIDMVVEIGNVSEKVKMQSGWISKAAMLLPLVDEMAALISLKFKQVPLELKDLSKEEREAMFLYAKEKYDVLDEHVEDLVEEGLDIASSLVSMIEQIMDFSKQFKKKA